MINDIDITHLVETFRLLIKSGWPKISEIQEKLIDDKIDIDQNYSESWLQANWETIVEQGIRNKNSIFLEIYGSGSDYNANSSRILWPGHETTHKIVCVGPNKEVLHDLISGDKITDSAIFDQFCSMEDEWISFNPPL